MTSASASPTFDLAIIGAGPVGTTLAILASQRGFRTVLVDAREHRPAPPDRRTFAIVRGSWRLLTAAGVTRHLTGATEPLNGLEAVDGGRHFFGLPAAAFGVDDLGTDGSGIPFGQMVPAEALQAALDHAATACENLTWLRPARFAALHVGPAQAEISLSDGAIFKANLVAACDGVNSSVRSALGIGVEGRNYGQSVFAATVKLARPHGGIARQLFTPEGPFATLPMPDHHANLAWYTKTGAAETLAKLPREAIERELNQRFENFAGRMTLASDPLAYPLVMQIAQKNIGPRTALLGDAAHRINPLAGQGLNLGFKDVGALIDVMLNARKLGLDPGAATTLTQYAEARRFDGLASAFFMDGVDRLYSNANPLLTPIRALALNAAKNFAPLRHAMAKQASADQDRLPSLMRAPSS